MVGQIPNEPPNLLLQNGDALLSAVRRERSDTAFSSELRFVRVRA